MSRRRAAYCTWKAFVSLCFCLLLVILGGSPADAYGDRIFAPDVLVSGEPVGATAHSTHSSGQHTVLTFGDTIMVTWYGAGPEGAGACVSRSLDGGSTFEAPVRANDVSVSCSGASLAADGCGNIYVVWADSREGPSEMANIYLSKSTDGGETFGPNVRVDDAAGDSSTQWAPAVAADDSGRVYVVWLDARGNARSGIYVTRSIDGGATFEPSQPLPNAEPPGPDEWPQYGPSIASSASGRVFVSYVDYRHVDGGPPLFVCVRTSNDAGATYSPPVDAASYVWMPWQTSVAAVGIHDVWVAWVDSDDYPMVAASSDGAQTFAPSVRVTDCPANDWEMPISLAADSSGWLAVAWKDSFSTIGVAESRDGGESFLPMMRLRGAGKRSYAGVFIDHDLTLYTVWTDFVHGSGGDIYLSKGVLDPPAGAGGLPEEEPRKPLALRIVPNPLTAGATVWPIPESRAGELRIYNVMGELVRSIEGKNIPLWWDRRDNRGARVPSGIYLLEGSFGGRTARAKAVVVR